jgi:hypothetical protein
MVENEVERIIATHFCREGSQEQLFISLLFSGGFIPFSQKTIIFKKLLKISYNDLYNECSWIFKRIDQIRELRNSFAHSHTTIPVDEAAKVTTKDEVSVKGVTLQILKDGQIIYKFISIEEAVSILEEAQALSLFLDKLHTEIHNRVLGNEPGKFIAKDLIEEYDGFFARALLKIKIGMK